MNIDSSLTLIEVIGAADFALAAARRRGADVATLRRFREQADQTLDALRSDHLSESEGIDILESIILDAEKLSCAA